MLTITQMYTIYALSLQCIITNQISCSPDLLHIRGTFYAPIISKFLLQLYNMSINNIPNFEHDSEATKLYIDQTIRYKHDVQKTTYVNGATLEIKLYQLDKNQILYHIFLEIFVCLLSNTIYGASIGVFEKELTLLVRWH